MVDLSEGTAEEALRSFRSVGRFRILVCGGDGTVGWVLSLLDGAKLEYTPPVAILPLGTGNDLARALGWGGGRHGARELLPMLEEVDRAQVSLLDRWSVSINNARPSRHLADLATPHRSAKRAPSKLIMQNYLGIGCDAQVALDWHRRRQLNPDLFSSRLRNKVHYVRMGIRHLLKPTGKDLSSKLVVTADGQTLALPPGTAGVIVLNIGSYGGGSDLWGVEDDDETDVGSHSPNRSGAVTPTEPSKLGTPTLGTPPQHRRSASHGRHGAHGGGDLSGAGGGGVAGGGTSHPNLFTDLPPEFMMPSRERRLSHAGTADRPSSRASTPQPGATGGGASGGRGEGRGSKHGGLMGEADAERSEYVRPQPSRPLSSPHSRSGSLDSNSEAVELLHGQLEHAYRTPTMDDGLLEVVAIRNVLDLAAAQISLSGAKRLCQCSSLSIASLEPLPLQVDGEPYELEPMFAPRNPMQITLGHHNQAVMLSKSKVRADGVALDALDSAMQAGVISVEQRNCVLREVARRTGSLKRRQGLSSTAYGSGSMNSLFSLDM